MEVFSALLVLCPPEQTAEQTFSTPVNEDAIALIMTSLLCIRFIPGSPWLAHSTNENGAL